MGQLQKQSSAQNTPVSNNKDSSSETNKRKAQLDLQGPKWTGGVLMDLPQVHLLEKIGRLFEHPQYPQALDVIMSLANAAALVASVRRSPLAHQAAAWRMTDSELDELSEFLRNMPGPEAAHVEFIKRHIQPSDVPHMHDAITLTRALRRLCSVVNGLPGSLGAECQEACFPLVEMLNCYSSQHSPSSALPKLGSLSATLSSHLPPPTPLSTQPAQALPMQPGVLTGPGKRPRQDASPHKHDPDVDHSVQTLQDAQYGHNKRSKICEQSQQLNPSDALPHNIGTLGRDSDNMAPQNQVSETKV